MMEHTIFIPNESEIDKLKSQIAEARRLIEYAELKKELQNIHASQIDQNQNFQGAMQSSDEHKVLKTQNGFVSFFEMIMNRTCKMLSPRPVIGSISALLIGMLCLAILYDRAHALGLGQYQHYLGMGILIAGGYQIIKSGSRSLFLPVVAAMTGFVLSASIPHGETLLTFDSSFYKYVMIAGIIGLANSMLHIE